MEVLEQNYNEAMEKPLRVLEIFNEFFGEDRVDMQGFPTLAKVRSSLPENSTVRQICSFINNKLSRNRGFILVHFPLVNVTNENNRSTIVRHLYAKILLDLEGRIIGKFLLNRSEYTLLHFMNSYMHSHINTIPFDNLSEFQTPCTGNGPINNTICSLARDFDEDLWRLFCLELDRFTQVESLSGGPYHRLESLLEGGRSNSYKVFTQISLQDHITHNVLQSQLTYPQVAEFIKYVIDSNILKFSYRNGGYLLAMSPTEYFVKVSNLFIKWYNMKYKKGEVNGNVQMLFMKGILGRYKFCDGSIMKERGSYRRDYRDCIGARVCTFKGRDITLVISDAGAQESEQNEIIMLNKTFAEYVFTKIFNVINFRYGNNSQNEGSVSGKKVHYI